MYNRYIPQENYYVPVEEPDGPEGAAAAESQSAREPRQGGNLLEGLGRLLDRDKSAPLGGILSAFGLEDLDSGDILLALIILLLISEGDNTELVITLGLMLLMGLGKKKEKGPDGNQPSGPGGL